jgi:PAS domain S-box-containing protein
LRLFLKDYAAVTKQGQIQFWKHLGLAAILVAAAYFMREGICRLLGGSLPPYITFYPAVMLAALVGGRQLGLQTTGLAFLATLFFILAPSGRPGQVSPLDLIGLILFSGISILLSIISDRYLRMRRQMKELVAQRTAELEKSRQAALVALENSVQAQKQAEQARESLREREQQLRLLVEHSPAAIAMFDVNMRYLVASRRWLSDYRLKEQDLVGKSHYEVFPELPERWKETHQRCLTGAVEKSEADPFPRADGSFDWVRWETRPWRTGNGAIGGLILFSEVITDRKRAEEELRRSEQNYREIFNATNDAIFLHDAATGRVLDVNDAMVRLFGFVSKEEILSGGIDNAWPNEPPFNAAEAGRRIRLAVEQGPQLFEWLTCKRNGERFWVEVSLSSSKIGGEGCVLAVVRDISQRKSHELEIARLTRLYATLSQVNQSIVRCQSRTELFSDICRVMIEFGEFRAVWIGERSNGDVLFPVAHLARGDDSTLAMPGWTGGCGVIGEILHTGCSAVCNNTASDARAGCCRSVMSQVGVKSCAAFPLHLQGDFWGAFSLCSDEENYFNPGELRLLEEIASNISYALDRLHGEENQRRAEDDLLQSEEQFRAMFETASIGMAQASVQSAQWLRVNKKMCDITGYSADELLQLHVGDITYFEDREQDGDLFKQVVSGDKPEYRMEKRYIRKDGKLIWVNVNMTVVRGADGQPLRTIATIEDITERRRGEEERLLLGTALEQAAEAIVITDLNGVILYANPAFERTSGYSHQEVVGRTPRILKSGEHSDAFYKELWDAILSGTVWHGHFINRHKDGHIFEENATISPVRNAAGKIVNYVAIKLDVTREVQLESQFRQAQKMEAIGTLAGGVAHDFNNILTSILMRIELAKMESNVSSGILEAFQHIQSDAQRAASLTRQLLLFSRRQVMQSRDLDLNDVMTNLTKMLQRIIGEDVRMQLSLHPAPLMTRADAGMLDQVLMNLAVNARDAMPHGGRLIIETSEKTVPDEQAGQPPDAAPGDYVCLSVSDTGMGIPADLLPRIFEPFFTTKPAGQGTGLGLATVFGIVKQHQGWLTVESEVGRGTTFKIYLPAIAAANPEVAEITRQEPRGGVETLLLAEDEESLRNIMKVILSRYGYTVLDAPNGKAALKLWAENRDRISLLITDMIMPGGMRGQELAKQMQAEKEGLKVIYISGYSPEIAGRELQLHQGENFLQKPFQPDALLEAARSCLDS